MKKHEHYKEMVDKQSKKRTKHNNADDDDHAKKRADELARKVTKSL